MRQNEAPGGQERRRDHSYSTRPGARPDSPLMQVTLASSKQQPVKYGRSEGHGANDGARVVTTVGSSSMGPYTPQVASVLTLARRVPRESDPLARQTGTMHREGTADCHVGYGRWHS
jgi:hypothetical protein